MCSVEIGDRVVRVHAIGGPDVLRIDHMPAEPPAPGEIAVQVLAIGLNRADVMFRRNTYIEKPVMPSRLGFEAVGCVTALGVGVQGFQIGQRVNVVPGAPLGAHGTCADWVNVPAARVMPCPDGLSDVQAAALWMSYGTPYGALIEVCRLHKGQIVLITAANSTVGLAAIQICRAAGAIPICTVLTEDLQRPVQEAGAEAVIVTGREGLARGLAVTAPDGIDVAFDAVGGPQIAEIAEVTRPRGTIVIHGALSNEPTPFPLKLRYNQDAALRILEPHGVLLGHRTYLAARDPAKADEVRNFRIDLIHEAETLNESFALQDGFSIAEYGARAFGVWQDPAQYGEVIWRFAPEAAARAAEFRFHPTQLLEPQGDGSLIVRFTAAGWIEMAWHLYQWGDKVEVIAPDGLRAMVEEYRRRDFGALP